MSALFNASILIRAAVFLWAAPAAVFAAIATWEELESERKLRIYGAAFGPRVTFSACLLLGLFRGSLWPLLVASYFVRRITRIHRSKTNNPRSIR